MFNIIKSIDDGFCRKVVLLGMAGDRDAAFDVIDKEVNKVDAPRMMGIKLGMPTDNDMSLMSYFLKKSYDKHDRYAVLETGNEKTYYDIVEHTEKEQ